MALCWWLWMVVAAAGARPNILWITVEDMSPNLGCYGDAFARTPHLDRFAGESVRYTRAFAASPVCSPSRSCLITGRYPVATGTHQMRSAFPLPPGVHGFPFHLRQAGYFTVNRGKTDYNTADEERLISESWDKSAESAHWRDPRRLPGQPFFAVFNDMTTHQSRTTVWSREAFLAQVQTKLTSAEIHDPALAEVPPYYPDTPVVRRTLARYADCVTLMDRNVGRILGELESDGLAEDTIVFFFSDHGAGLPRHKRMLQDSGMQVPLLVRFPPKYRHLAPAQPGTATDRLVSFVDFAPTVFNLAGIALPDGFQGRPFAGAEPAAPREYVYGSRDRVDEAFDMMRSLRDGSHLYIRHYQPLTSCNQPEAYSDLSEIRREISTMAMQRPEAMTPAQLDYAGPRKPVEAFFDVAADPHQVRNLLDHPLSPGDAAALERFRREFRKMRLEIGDRGAMTEDSLWRLADAGQPPDESVLAGAWKAADQVGFGTPAVLLAELTAEETERRYWALQALRAAGPVDSSRLVPLMSDPALPVRFEAAGWLAGAPDHRDRALEVLIRGLEEPGWWNALHACRVIELLGNRAERALPAMRALYLRTRWQESDADLFLAFSSGAWLGAMGEKVAPWDFGPEASVFKGKPLPPLRPGRDLGEWALRREELRRDWEGILGPVPKTADALEVEILGEERLPGFRRQHLRYRIDASTRADGYLLLPHGAGEKRPGVVVFHPTSKDHAKGVAGLADPLVLEAMHGVHLAELGYVVLCPRNYLFNEGADFAAHTAEVLRRWPTGMARMLWDGIRALDVLESRPEVDPGRLGAAGHSLGAKEALYLAAFDERVRGTVFSEGGIGLAMSNWDAPWYLGPRVRQAGFAHDHHELLAMIAPRAVLVLAGDSADTDESRLYLETVRPVYAFHQAGAALQFHNHRQGHPYGAAGRERRKHFFEALWGTKGE
ncbi:MAG: sulfatase-like hydrolase/transferase [Verrucomicrobia bacterium]|nr:sulfatase-like hydrolase/transferase [Verrucomicrobiota bacterium]